MRLIRLSWPVVLLCLCLAGQAQVTDDKWDRADRETVRLPPTHFVGVPKPVIATLSELGCRIPQPGDAATKNPRNLIRGEFMKARRTQWAALCSRKLIGVRTFGRTRGRGKFWTSAIIVIDENGRVRAELASRQDAVYLQGGGHGEIYYSRGLYLASADHILSKYQAYGGPKPPPMDHNGIGDAFIEKGSSVHYFHEGKWLELTGAD